MKAASLKYGVLMAMVWLISVIMVLVPFHAFLTVWLSTFIGHYTALRLWKEVLLAICGLGALYLLATDHKIRTHTLSRRLVWLIWGYVLVQLACGLVAYKRQAVDAKALAYGLLINLRFLAFFLVTWAVALRTSRLNKLWPRLLLWPAAVVVIFGVIQEFFLTPRFLEHFGYSKYTILPFQYVDNNHAFLRVQSTLRGANPLGAYLVVIVSVLLVYLLSAKDSRRFKQGAAFLAITLTTLFFTYSRSAWIGTALAATGIGLIALKKKNTKILIVGLAAGLIVLGGGVLVGLRHNSLVENTLFHTTAKSHSKVTSNGSHLFLVRNGVEDILKNPLGKGPGTAGPASVYNNHPPRIAENYFVQIGQETGWLGLALFLLINAGVGYILWLRRSEPLALALFASLIGLTVVNLLLHAWADDTLAYIWWGLAGIAIGMAMTGPLETKNREG
ncbi:MAG TPA: O-antigen ligase family protein [Candidatus Saccharimonadales bacterium]|nr:O-antigen ligase family protein [Candidatus Saccharimonadales bacterium]